MTFQDCVRNSRRSFPIGFETRSEHLEALLASQDNAALCNRTASISYKSSTAFEELISKYADHLDQDLLTDHPALRLLVKPYLAARTGRLAIWIPIRFCHQRDA